MMESHARREDTLVGAAQGAVTHNLDAVEETVDTAIADAVHEARSGAQQVVDQTLNRVRGKWEEQRPKIEDYMAAHPWMVLAGLLVVGYLLAGIQRSRTS